MKVCQVIDRLDGGGQERVAVELALGLSGAVETSGLLATRGGGDYESLLCGREVVNRIERRESRLDVRAWWRVYRWLAALGFDVLHTHSPGSLRAALLLRRASRLSYVIVSHVQMLPPGGTHYRVLAERWLRSSRDGVACTIVTNEGLRRYLVEECGYRQEAVVELPNPVDFTAWDRRRDDGDPDGLRVVMVAQWRKQKDHETAIRAAAVLRDRGIRSTWTFVGEENPTLTGPAQALARDLGLSESVRFLGRSSDIPSVLARSDVGVLATHFEGSPVAVIEYCAAGIPSVVSLVDGTTQLVSPDHGIMGVAPGDPVALADAVARLRDSPTRVALGAAANAHMRSIADRSIVIAAVRGLYTNVLSANQVSEAPQTGMRESA